MARTTSIKRIRDDAAQLITDIRALASDYISDALAVLKDLFARGNSATIHYPLTIVSITMWMFMLLLLTQMLADRQEIQGLQTTIKALESGLYKNISGEVATLRQFIDNIYMRLSYRDDHLAAVAFSLSYVYDRAGQSLSEDGRPIDKAYLAFREYSVLNNVYDANWVR